MTTKTTPRLTPTLQAESQARSWATRATIVVATTAAAEAVWSIVTIGFDRTIRGPSFDGTPPIEVGLAAVLVSTLAASLLGWALLAGLDRWTSRPLGLWTAIAATVAAISLVGPLSGSGVSAGDRVALIALHLFVAAVYIALMRTTIWSPKGGVLEALEHEPNRK